MDMDIEKLADIGQTIQGLVILLAGLIALGHFSLKFHTRDPKIEKIFEGLRLIPTLVVVAILPFIFLILVIIWYGFNFDSIAIYVVITNIFGTIVTMIDLKYFINSRGTLKSIIVLLLLATVFIINMILLKNHFNKMHMYLVLYQLYTTLLTFISVVVNMYNLMFNDIKRKVIEIKTSDQVFEAELLSRTKDGDLLVRKVTEPQSEYWINRDEIKHIKVDSGRIN